MSHADTARDLAALRAEAASAARGQLTRELAAAILAADLLDRGRMEQTRVGPLYLESAGWSLETSMRASAAGEAGSPEWYAALGRHEHAVLTGDGRGANRSAWCRCAGGAGAVPPEEWVPYEYWTAAGREEHGFAHAGCRRKLQEG